MTSKPTWSKWSPVPIGEPPGDWWCVPVLTRSERKRRGLRRTPKPHPAKRKDCPEYPIGNDGRSIHKLCGYRDPLGRIIPWQDDPRNPHNAAV